jgi:hypothetical protein
MSLEQAETYLRLLAESELRRVRARPAGSYWHTPRLQLAAQALCAAGAIDAGTAGRIRGEADFALAARQPAEPGLSLLALGRRLTRAPLVQPLPAVSGKLPVCSPSAGPARPIPCRVVPVGRVIPGNGLRRDLTLLAYVHGPAGARFTVAGGMAEFAGVSDPRAGPARPAQPGPGRPARPPSGPVATDDRGVSYQLGHVFGPGAGSVLVLRPDPPHPVRWLEVLPAPGEPTIRIELDPPDLPDPWPQVTVTRTATSPGEVILDAIAARILTTAPIPSPGKPGEPVTASADLRAYIGSKPGDITAAMLAVGALSPASPVPGQLAALCERLGIPGHGIAAPPAADLPEPWQSMLTQRRPPPASLTPGSWLTAVAELPELDGTQLTILGLHHGARGTTVHMLVSGATPDDDWDFSRAVRPLPSLWARDSNGHWHATRTGGIIPWSDAGLVMLWLEIVPALAADTVCIDVMVAGPSARARVRLPLRWR